MTYLFKMLKMIYSDDLIEHIERSAASSIFFGFLLNIAVNSPPYFRFLDNIMLLAGPLCMPNSKKKMSGSI
jgi:hypothetical protein